MFNIRKLSFHLLICSLLFSGCIAPGTGTGNPQRCDGGVASAAPVPWPIAMLSSTCSVLQRCHENLIFGDCMLKVNELTGFPVRFGAGWIDSPQTMNALSKALSSGLVQVDTVAAKICLRELEELNCSAPSVQNGYVPGAEDPYSELKEMIPDTNGSCRSVFSEKEQGYETNSTMPADSSDDSGASSDCL